jgi:membrane protease YdiL (CAAX protease family)
VRAVRFAAPPRTSLAGAITVLSAVALFSLAVAVPAAADSVARVAAAGTLFLAATLCRSVYAIHLTLFILLLFALVAVFPAWPLNLLAPLVAYGAVTAAVPSLRQTLSWLRRGRIDSQAIVLIAVTAVVSALFLVGWVTIEKPDLVHHLALIPAMPVWAYPLAGLGFALLNAAMEEAVFRGIVMESLDSALGAGYASVVIQAVAFAALHYPAGFPNGASGFVMVLVYGIMLGVIRRRSNGMLAPFVAHVAADITIYSVLAYNLIQSRA